MAVPYYFPYPGHPGPGGKMPPFDPSFMQRYVKNAFKYLLTKCISYMYIFSPERVEIRFLHKQKQIPMVLSGLCDKQSFYLSVQ